MIQDKVRSHDRLKASIKTAIHAHTNLNTFQAVIAVLEGGTLYSLGEKRTVEKIIKLCKAEQQRQLKKLDGALAKLS